MPLGIRAANRKRACMAQPRGSTPLRHGWTSLGSTPPDAADLQTIHLRAAPTITFIVPWDKGENPSPFLDAILDLPPENWSRDNASVVG